LSHEFRKRQSPNQLSVVPTRTGDWWLGEPADAVYQAAAAAITTVWGREPVPVREGGTMPITSFLTSTLRAPALHLPLGWLD
jgi:Cys-Gly metallodipeptidase DUG1